MTRIIRVDLSEIDVTADDPIDKLLDFSDPESLLDPLRDPLREFRFKPSGLSSEQPRVGGFGLRVRNEPSRFSTTACSFRIAARADSSSEILTRT